MIQFDLNSAEFLANPYPVYDQMRSTDPVFWSEQNSYWLLTRYKDIVSLIPNEHLSSNRIVAHADRMPHDVKEQFRPFFAAVSSWMLMVDPPDHTRLRGLVNKRSRLAWLQTCRALFRSWWTTCWRASRNKVAWM